MVKLPETLYPNGIPLSNDDCIVQSYHHDRYIIHPLEVSASMQRILFHGVGMAILTTVTALTGASASAATLTATSIVGSWNNIVLTDGSVDGGGTLIGAGTNEIRWGTPLDGANKSGFNFNASLTPTTITTETNFFLGELTHLNFPVFPPSVTSADLNISLDLGGVLQSFAYTFTNEETDNGSLSTCPAFQQSLVPCDDKITFGTGFTSSTFLIASQEYTLQLVGFVGASTTSLAEFVTQEGAANTALLVGRITTPPPVEAVPEPAAIAALATIGIYIVTRRSIAHS